MVAADREPGLAGREVGGMATAIEGRGPGRSDGGQGGTGRPPGAARGVEMPIKT